MQRGTEQKESGVIRKVNAQKMGTVFILPNVTTAASPTKVLVIVLFLMTFGNESIRRKLTVRGFYVQIA